MRRFPSSARESASFARSKKQPGQLSYVYSIIFQRKKPPIEMGSQKNQYSEQTPDGVVAAAEIYSCGVEVHPLFSNCGRRKAEVLGVVVGCIGQRNIELELNERGKGHGARG